MVANASLDREQDKTFEERLLWMTLGLVLLVWWVFMVVNNR